MANHEGKEWEWQGEKYRCEAGQFITSLDNIKYKCGKDVKIQNIRTALKKFEKYEFLTNESTKTGRLITIVNWRVYQDTENKTNKATNKELTKHQQRANKELTPNKNDKNDKNDKKIYSRNLILSLSLGDYNKLKSKYGVKLVDKKIEQYKSWVVDRYVSKDTDVYKILNIWCNKDYKQIPKTEKPVKFNMQDLVESLKGEVK